MRVLATLSILLATLATADAKPKPKGKAGVDAHMERAAKAHKAGKFDVALDELKAAYALDPQPKLLFAIAQVHAKLDDCVAAIEHYEKFLDAEKDKAKRTVVQQAIDACKQKLADKPAPAAPTPVEAATQPPPVETSPAPPPVEPAPPPKAAPPAPPVVVEPVRSEPAVAVSAGRTHSPWYRDVLGDALVLGGVGAGVASSLVYRGAQSDLDAAEDATSLADYHDRRDSAEGKQLVSVVLAAGSVALVAGGIARYVLRDDGRETHRVAITPLVDGGLITWSGGF